MKTIKLSILLFVATFISCSDSDEIYQGYEDNTPPVYEAKETYKLREYYEKKIVVNRQTTSNHIDGYYSDDSPNRIILGRVAFSGRYRNKIVLDTLVIDGSKFRGGIDKIVFDHSYGYGTINQIENTYTTINHLEIIGIDASKGVTIVGNTVYDKIKINSSNISIEKLNEYSITTNNSPYDLFEKVDLKRKQVSFDFKENSTPQYPSDYHNFVNKEIGYIDYGNDNRRGTKYQLISRTKQ